MLKSRPCAEGMRDHLNDLERESEIACANSPGGRLTLGFDYVVCAQMLGTPLEEDARGEER